MARSNSAARYLPPLLLCFIAISAAAACEGESNEFTEARAVNIDQRDDGCTPASFSIDAGETVRLRVTNHTNGDYFLGVEGDRPSSPRPMTVPPGQTKNTYYVGPEDRDPDSLRCYTEGGPSSTIEVVQ